LAKWGDFAKYSHVLVMPRGEQHVSDGQANRHQSIRRSPQLSGLCQAAVMRYRMVTILDPDDQDEAIRVQYWANSEITEDEYGLYERSSACRADFLSSRIAWSVRSVSVT